MPRLPVSSWPAQAPAGLKDDTTVLTAVDLLPTFCTAAGVSPPTDANGDGDGENMLPALKGESVQRTRPIFWRINGDKKNPNFWPDLAVRDGDWKLLTTFDGQRVELHNLKSNRAVDVAKDQSKDHPEIVARLTKLALDWKATLPTKADPSCLAKPQASEPKKLSEKAAPKSEAPAKDRSIPFNRWDTNKDEFLTLEEYKTGQHAMKHSKSADKMKMLVNEKGEWVVRDDVQISFKVGGEKYEIAGFYWQQGWNDMCTAPAIPEYAQNLVNLVKDLRKEFNVPNMPVVVGQLGNGGPVTEGAMFELRMAQEEGTKQIKNALFIKTTNFARPAELSPCPTHGHHWFANAESYFLIGDAAGEGMKSLLK